MTTRSTAARTGHDDQQPSWPVQYLLPGQAAAPEGPVDMIGMYVLHHAFRRDLAAFAAAAERTPVSDRRTWTLLAQRWRFFAAELHHHHSAEDDHLWPLLLERTDAAGTQVLAAMQTEHEEIDPTLEACARLFARLEDTADEVARRELAQQVRAAQAILDHHLSHEETAAIPIIQRVLSNADWQALENGKFQEGRKPTDLLRFVPWIVHRIPEQQLAEISARAPKIMRIVLALRGKAFRRHEQRVFAYADRS